MQEAVIYPGETYHFSCDKETFPVVVILLSTDSLLSITTVSLLFSKGLHVVSFKVIFHYHCFSRCLGSFTLYILKYSRDSYRQVDFVWEIV